MNNPQVAIIVTYVKETTGKKHCRQVTIIRNYVVNSNHSSA